jgi:hypothetical protein
MRLTTSIANLTIGEILIKTSRLTQDARFELENTPEYWTLRKAWPDMTEETRTSILKAYSEF